ncbi:hypothetical protein SELMODRAFT_233613 [Selaginella moellendorffii]|uniref:Uncharacterized protein n=1 Tax=Selaginella moellendorffii TaxID=88036 RepID=D8SC24_SELML|nr:alpha-soluble NSF attachment protein 2 [Selaginella moellendorffii]EFJ18019.1 hypothetical protein SELMODRAFT_233613 [Selaginella moellendorffii]|eukprot:XP_002980834.1 alpha-soluble NSF attachment protein 2 [Selaginella moellendorffii]
MDALAKAKEFESKADRKLKGWGLFGNKYEDTVELLQQAANHYKVAKSWDKAANCFVRVAEMHVKLDSRYEAATSYVDAAKCYMKNKPQDAINALNTATNIFLEMGKLSIAAKHFKDVGELYEKEEKWQEAMESYEKAADFYQGEEVTSSANQCKLKVAQFASQLELYPKAIEVYETVAKDSMGNNLLKYSVKGYLLSAGLCHLCSADHIAIQNAIERYEDLDPTFSNTREHKFLKDLAEAIEQEDVEKFTDVVKEFDSMTRLDGWKTTMLLRAKNAMKAKIDEDDDLT